MQDTADPAEVVEAGVVDEQVGLRVAEEGGHRAAHRGRGVADADDTQGCLLGEGLSDQAGGIGEVDEPGVGGDGFKDRA